MGLVLGEDLGDDWDQMVDEMLEEELSGSGQPGGETSDDLGWA